MLRFHSTTIEKKKSVRKAVPVFCLPVFLFLFLVVAESSAQMATADSVSDFVRKGDMISLSSIFKNNSTAINQFNSNGHTALILAAYKGNLPVVQYLIENGAAINLQSNEGTALHGAAYKGNYDVVALLLQKGAQINLQDKNGTTALMYASFSGNVKIASLLLENGAIITLTDKTGKSALDFANGSGSKELISLFEKK